MRVNELKPIYSKFLPGWDKMEEGILYISLEYEITQHFCACGCKGQTSCPIFEGMLGEVEGWKLESNNGLVSLSPSIGNWSLPCRSHYMITENKIVWLPS